jgi:phospholipid/cholesterol/gamma-HCH transport system substrate-binding protein
MTTIRPWRVMVAAALTLVVVLTILRVRPTTARHRLSITFTSAVGIHEGSGVRVLGVAVGEVTRVTPHGRTVTVDVAYRSDVPIPADARALIVPPSVVSDRYVQLAPAYTGGDSLPDGAALPVEHTAVPIELDEIYSALDKLNTALGPQGANADGALSNLVRTGAANLGGNGQDLHDTLAGLSQALSTVSSSRDDLFGSIANLQQFTTMLAQSDASVRQFNATLADVAEQLAAEREELTAAVQGLARALSDIAAFVRDNRAELAANVKALANLTGVLVRQQRALMQVADVAPLALSNLNLAYNGRSGTLDTRDNAMGPYDPATYVCKLIIDRGIKVPPACTDLAKLLSTQKLPLPDELKRLLP